MLILGIVYECVVSYETSLKPFSLKIKNDFPLVVDKSFYHPPNCQLFGNVLDVNVLFDT